MILNERMCNKTEEWILKQSRANVLFYVEWRFIHGMLNHMCLLHISFIEYAQFCFCYFFSNAFWFCSSHSIINIANKQLKLGSCLNSFSVCEMRAFLSKATHNTQHKVIYDESRFNDANTNVYCIMLVIQKQNEKQKMLKLYTIHQKASCG